MAIAWLKTNGFEILHTNWRYGHLEVDIIARKSAMLHFVEVKLRKFFPGSFPEQSVTRKKFRFLKRAAEEYLYRNPRYRDLRFNILAITLHPDREPEYFFIEDVFL